MSLIEDKRNSTENLKAKAILMLFDENYHLAKAKIMKPINDFGNLMEARTLAKLKKMELYADQLQHLALLIDLILAIAAIRIHINTQRGKTIAAQTTQLKSEFIANMSHEIRTPMNAIIGLIDLILETELSEVQRKYLEKIQRSSSTLLGILNDILDISKIESGKIELEYIEFDPSRTLFEIAELFYFRAEEKGLKIFVEVDPNFASTIICDQLRFKQIISNLLGNAIKFTEFGQISVRLKILEKKTDQVILKIEITDTGIGIRKEDLAKLFRSFSQADTSITRKFGGTGLGLVISKQLIERMGGEIDVESIYGKGSTFAFTLPCKIGEMNLEKIPSEDSKIKKTTYYENAKPIAGAKVLLVEDNKLNQEVACAFLKKAGLSVSTAENGELAIDLINLHDFDCVLMDVQMPVLDGYEASGFIREKLNKKDLPIIAMTAAALQQDRDQCLAAGMNDHIGKPIRPDLLINILLKWIKPRKF